MGGSAGSSAARRRVAGGGRRVVGAHPGPKAKGAGLSAAAGTVAWNPRNGTCG